MEKEASQFKTDLQIGTKYYRARVIDLIDDNSLEKGIGKTLDGKFSGYNDVNLREPVLGISGEGRNIWNEHGSAFFSELMLRFFEPVRGENAYRATQIIPDYLRKTGVDGIKYRSFFVSRWV